MSLYNEEDQFLKSIPHDPKDEGALTRASNIPHDIGEVILGEVKKVAPDFYKSLDAGKLEDLANQILQSNPAAVSQLQKQYAAHNPEWTSVEPKNLLKAIITQDRAHIKTLDDVDTSIKARLDQSEAAEKSIIAERQAWRDGINHDSIFRGGVESLGYTFSSKTMFISPLLGINVHNYGTMSDDRLAKLSDDEHREMKAQFEKEYHAEIGQYGEEPTKQEITRLIRGGDTQRGSDFHGLLVSNLEFNAKAEAAEKEKALRDVGIDLTSPDQRVAFQKAMQVMGHPELAIAPEHLEKSQYAHTVIEQFQKDFAGPIQENGGNAGVVLAAVNRLSADTQALGVSPKAFQAAVSAELYSVKDNSNFAVKQLAQTLDTTAAQTSTPTNAQELQNDISKRVEAQSNAVGSVADYLKTHQGEMVPAQLDAIKRELLAVGAVIQKEAEVSQAVPANADAKDIENIADGLNQFRQQQQSVSTSQLQVSNAPAGKPAQEQAR